MSSFHMSDEKMALVAGLAQQGKSLNEIAAELQISFEMARSAARKWPVIERIQKHHTI